MGLIEPFSDFIFNFTANSKNVTSLILTYTRNGKMAWHFVVFTISFTNFEKNKQMKTVTF